MSHSVSTNDCSLQVLEVAKVLLDRGCYEVSFGDTIGSGNPLSTHRLLTVLKEGGIPVEK